VVEVTGKNIMGQFVGSTAIRVREVMSQAKGGILFIDGERHAFVIRMR
jgi:hypothetical protein